MTRLSAILFLLAASAVNAERAPPPPNARIDPQAFLAVARNAMQHRKTRRIEEQEFLKNGEKWVMKNGMVKMKKWGQTLLTVWTLTRCFRL